MTEVFLEQPMASPGFAKYSIFLLKLYVLSKIEKFCNKKFKLLPLNFDSKSTWLFKDNNIAKSSTINNG